MLKKNINESWKGFTVGQGQFTGGGLVTGRVTTLQLSGNRLTQDKFRLANYSSGSNNNIIQPEIKFFYSW